MGSVSSVWGYKSKVCSPGGPIGVTHTKDMERYLKMPVYNSGVICRFNWEIMADIYVCAFERLLSSVQAGGLH